MVYLYSNVIAGYNLLANSILFREDHVCPEFVNVGEKFLLPSYLILLHACISQLLSTIFICLAIILLLLSIINQKIVLCKI